MAEFPWDRRLDSTLDFLAEGYEFGLNRCRRLGSDVFHARLMLWPATFTMGEDAARMFYHPDRFTRVGAVPLTTVTLLQGTSSVQSLEERAHRQRKQLFLSLIMPERVHDLALHVAREWGTSLWQWERMSQVTLHTEVEEMLCRAVCAWSGIPLSDREAKARTRELAAMIDGAGAVGPRNWKGQLLRLRTERWANQLIEAIRDGRRSPPTDSAAYLAAWHRDAKGRLLDAPVAAVELINVLRPTVAVARFITFAAVSLHRWPECRDRIRSGESQYLEWFAQEVRRFYPFFPAVAGLARHDFEWRRTRFRRGDWVFLDLYATNHDPRIWGDPENFRPERFREWNGSPFNFVAQGAGSHAGTHRCPGEVITVELLKLSAAILSTAMEYDVPKQDLTIDLNRLPAIPRSRFVMTNVRASLEEANRLHDGATGMPAHADRN